MAVGPVGGIGSIGAHVQIQNAGQPNSNAPIQPQNGTKIDGDGDYDNSTPAEDAAEGKASLVNLTA